MTDLQLATTTTEGPTTRSWDVSRFKCGLYAIGMPVALGALSLLVLALWPALSDSTDPERREAERTIVALALLVLVVGVSLLSLREFLPLALHGGSLAAAPEGLRFRLGRRTMLFRWASVANAAVEGRSDVRGSSYNVLAIRFAGTGFRWPRAFSLWFSTPTCLCISPTILDLPAAVVAAELEEARLRFGAAGPQTIRAPVGGGAGLRYAEPLSDDTVRRVRRRARVKARLLAVVTFVFTAICLYWGVKALLAGDVLGVLGWLAFTLGTVVVGLFLWFFGDGLFTDDGAG